VSRETFYTLRLGLYICSQFLCAHDTVSHAKLIPVSSGFKLHHVVTCSLVYDERRRDNWVSATLSWSFKIVCTAAHCYGVFLVSSLSAVSTLTNAT